MKKIEQILLGMFILSSITIHPLLVSAEDNILFISIMNCEPSEPWEGTGEWAGKYPLRRLEVFIGFDEDKSPEEKIQTHPAFIITSVGPFRIAVGGTSSLNTESSDLTVNFQSYKEQYELKLNLNGDVREEKLAKAILSLNSEPRGTYLCNAKNPFFVLPK